MEIDFCPRWILARLGVPERSRHHFAIWISTALILLLVPIIPHVPHFCLMKKILGIPCPGCGISHSVMATLRLDFITAWLANPAGIGVALLFCFQVVARPFAIALPQAGAVVASISRYGSNFTMVLLGLVWTYRML